MHAVNAHGDDSAESAPVPSLHGDSINGGSGDLDIRIYAVDNVLVDEISPVHVQPGQPYVLDLSPNPDPQRAGSGSGRPHRVTTASDAQATFLDLPGIGDWDFVPLA